MTENRIPSSTGEDARAEPLATQAEPDETQPEPGQTQPEPVSARAAMNALAIVAFVGSFVVGLVGVVCGLISLGQVRRTGERGRGLAVAGIVVGAAQTVTAGLLSIVLAAAIATAGSAVAVGPDRVSPQLPALDTALACVQVSAVLDTRRDLIKAAAADSDPRQLLSSLAGVSGDLAKVADEVGDKRVAAAVRDAAREVDAVVAELTPIVDDPAAAPTARTRVAAHEPAVRAAFAAVDAACTPGR